MIRQIALWLAMLAALVMPVAAQAGDPLAAAAYVQAQQAQTAATTNTTTARQMQADYNRSRIASPAIVMAQGSNTYNSAYGWRPNDLSAQVISNDSTITRRGLATTKLDMTATTGAFNKTYRIAFPSTVSCTGPVGIWLYSPAATVGLSATLGWSSDTPAAYPPTAEATNEYQLPAISDAWQAGVWSFISVSGPSGKIFGPDYLSGQGVTTVGSPTAGTIKQAELIVSFNSGVPSAQRLLWIDDVECGGKVTKPMVVIGFDGANDSTTSFNNKTAPLIANNLPFYLAGDGNSWASGVVTNPSIVGLSQGGYMDIISQGMYHDDYGASPNLLLTEFPQSLTLISAAGLVPLPTLMAYPYNSRNATTDANAASLGIKCARSSGGNARIPYGTTGTVNPLALPTWDIDNTTAAQTEAVIAEAEASGSNLVMYGHAVTTNAGSSTNTNLTEYNNMIAYLAAENAAGRVEVVKMSDFCRRIGAF